MKSSLLLFGLDTLECAYYLGRNLREGIDFDALGAKKEALRAAKSRHSSPVKLGSEEFLLASHGTGSGYPFLLENEAFSIQCGPTNIPSFFVTYRSYALWQYGAKQLHERFLNWAESIGYIPLRQESISRADFAFDYLLSELDFDEDSFVTKAAKDNQHRKHRKIQTFSFGEGHLRLRVYDKCAEIQEKSGKSWFFDLWGTDKDVWRIEWQVRKDWLHRFGIRGLEDLFERQGDLLRALTNDHTTLRLKSQDSNRSRWPLHPLWIDLQSRTNKLTGLGIYRELDYEKLSEERMLRIAISIYGYLKRIAAIEGLNQAQEKITLSQAMSVLHHRLLNIHEPMSWHVDVERKMNEMRLSPW